MTFREMFKSAERYGFADDSDVEVSNGHLTILKYDLPEEKYGDAFKAYDLELATGEVTVTVFRAASLSDDYKPVKSMHFDKDGKCIEE